MEELAISFDQGSPWKIYWNTEGAVNRESVGTAALVTEFVSYAMELIGKQNGIIRRYFGKQWLKKKIKNIAAKAGLKFGIDVWVLKKREEQRLEASQIEYLRRLVGINKLDGEGNQSVREKLVVQNSVREVGHCQHEWLQHLDRRDTNRIPNQALQYEPNGGRKEDVRGKDGGTNFALRV